MVERSDDKRRKKTMETTIEAVEACKTGRRGEGETDCGL